MLFKCCMYNIRTMI